jgi:hypothetical protein
LRATRQFEAADGAYGGASWQAEVARYRITPCVTMVLAAGVERPALH